ncbi:MAG TPA: hypothetical protein VKB86_02455, partial [Pyrinomonadaceae bacterium]|nr:hypothetical protein [Pyrinomonadaceae bacterium]
ILTRADCVRAARELGLSLRMTERKFILKSLFAQDAEAVLDWLIMEADRWASYKGFNVGSLEEIAKWWQQRASATHALLKELKLSASEVIS